MRYPSIQILRGVAAILVVLYHSIANSKNHLNFTPLNNFFNFGFVGVDFFFVLSGFIITYVHFNDLKFSKNLEYFLKRRLIRLFPIYWLVALLTLMIYISSTPAYLRDLGLTMDLRNPLILQYLIKCFFLIPQEIPYLVGPSWSLSYELYFYLVFAFSIVLGYKFAKYLLPLWALIIIVYNLTTHHNNFFYLDFLLNILILEFLVGCLLAYLVIRKFQFRYIYIFLVMAITLTLIYLEVDIQGLSYERNIYSVLLFSLFFASMTFVAVKFDTDYPNIKYSKLLLLIGDASYSIYLIHNMTLSALTRSCAIVLKKFNLSFSLTFLNILIIIAVIITGVILHLTAEKYLIAFFNRKLLKKKENKVLIVEPK